MPPVHHAERRSQHRAHVDQLIEAAPTLLQRACRRHPNHLEGAIRSFAAEMRRLEVPIERVLVLLSHATESYALRATERERFRWYRPEVVKWAIDAYFDSAE